MALSVIIDLIIDSTRQLLMFYRSCSQAEYRTE